MYYNIAVDKVFSLTTEGKWFVAECPVLHIATQGKTEKEVKENMQDLIEEYLDDPDTPKEQERKASGGI